MVGTIFLQAQTLSQCLLCDRAVCCTTSVVFLALWHILQIAKDVTGVGSACQCLNPPGGKWLVSCGYTYRVEVAV